MLEPRDLRLLPLGGPHACRPPGLAKVSEEVRIQDWVGTHCSADNENCTGTMCCSNPTSQCYEKSHGWAVCMRGCNPGQPREGDADDNPWTCAALGPRTPRAWGHPSLYCFAVAQIWSPEGDVIQAQINTDGGAGIFACEQTSSPRTEGNSWAMGPRVQSDDAEQRLGGPLMARQGIRGSP